MIATPHLLANRPSMDDEQRRAMFARLRFATPSQARMGRGGGGRGRSQGEADDLRSRLRSASDLSDIEQKLKDYGLWGSVIGPAGAVPQRLLAALSKLKALPTAISAAVTSATLGEFRKQNPTMDPRLEHYVAMGQQIAAYVAAISGLGASKQLARAGLEKIPVGSSTLAAEASAALAKFGETLARLGTAATGKLPDPLRRAADRLYQSYTKLADYTGASLADLGNAPGAPRKLAAARDMRLRASDMKAQADAIARAADEIAMAEKTGAGRILAKSHEGSLVDWESAQRMYGEGAAKWYAADRGAAASRATATAMRRQALEMEARAAGLDREARDALIKSGLVAAGLVAKETHDEARIRSLQRQMEQAFREGENFSVDAEQPRGAAGTALAFAMGTLGNPIEKQFRYGQEKYAASVAAYRAKYDAIAQAEKSGELSPAEARAQRDILAQYKPKNMAGKTAWTFAPASAAFLAWKGGQIAQHFDQQATVGKVKRVYDGDTIELVSGQIVRMLGVDTPESVHPTKPAEYLGPEASAFQKKRLTGKTVRIVESPGATTDKYGRSLGYVETLPGPLDKALAIPGIGKYIPAIDQNKKLIQAGYGQPRYLELSGGHAREIEYDKATLRAIQKGVGVHSPEGLAKLEYHYTPFQEKKRQEAIKRGYAVPDAGPSGASTALGVGLMTTGQAGIFKPMGKAGTVAAQTWNAVLAALGTRDYNRQAAQSPVPATYRRPKAVKTEYERQAEDVLRRRK